MKKTYIFIIVFISAIVIAGIIVINGQDLFHKGHAVHQNKAVYYCPMHPTYTSDRPGDCPICNMKLVKRVAVEAVSYEKAAEEICIEHNCTMKDCGMRVTVNLMPGERVSCPVCGEYITAANGKLTEVSKGKTGGGPTVTISPEKQQLIGVKTEPVKRKNLIKSIIASGKIAYDPELVVAQEEFIYAIKSRDNAEDIEFKEVSKQMNSLVNASRNKLKLSGMSEDEITGLEKTRNAQTNLYLPKEGENVWAYISIYEYEIGLVKRGASVEIEAVAYPGEVFQGKIVSINPVLDPAARTNQIRVEVLNTLDKLKPEMFVNAKINIDLGEKLALPELAVMDTGIRKIVYLSREGGLLEAREVKLGQKAEGYYEILSGLNEGDIVVTSGNFFIDSESKLKSALEGTGHQHGQ